MPYLHLPVQSGSDAVLEAMNRQHTADHYRRLVDRIRAARPDIALSSDFIVGFPGETDRDFEATMALVRDVTFASAFSFKFSPRPGTPAAAARKQVPDDVMSARLDALQALLRAQQDAFAAAFVGQTVDVLFERTGRHPGQLVGKTPYQHGVHADAPASMMGKIARVTIVEARTNSFLGRLASPQLEAV
jgi:tRNA-2-methylthio-N6-dimethylallyladenosine synthase